jgi:hypothetical protein
MFRKNIVNIKIPSPIYKVVTSKTFKREASTTSLLEKLKDSPDRMTKDVASHILSNYAHQDINKANTIGFWWHEKTVKEDSTSIEGNHTGIGFGFGFRTTHGLNNIKAHASCNPLSHPNHGPWETDINYDKFWKSDKSITKNEFEKVGFNCIQNDGPDTGKGDKSLGFKNPNP